jgi:cell division transport system permease protein
MVVYLDATSTDAHAQSITDVLMELPAVERVNYVPREQALEHLRAALGERDEIVEGIEVGMLPASLEVTLAEGVKDVAAAHPVVDRLSATAGVEEVEFLGEWVDQLTAFLGGVRGAGASVFVFVFVACLAIIWAATRLSVRRRDREAEIVELCGGTSRFTRGPMMMEGAVVGALAAVIGATVLWALYQAVAPGVESTLSAFGTSSLSFLPAGDIGAALVIGTGLGAIGALLAGGRRVHA